MKFIPAILVTIVFLLICYITFYQFAHIDKTPARVVVDRWWVIVIILVLITIFPWVERNTTLKNRK